MVNTIKMKYSELKILGIRELKRIAKSVGISVDDYKKFKSGTKDKLALLLSRKSAVKNIETVPKSPARKSRSPARKSRSSTRKVSVSDSCSPLTDSQCNRSSKHRKPDIVKIALKCGIETGKKTRSELCAEIAGVLGKGKPSNPLSLSGGGGGATPPKPTSGGELTKKEMVKMTIKNLQGIARDNKIAGFSKYKKADQKPELADLILKHLKNKRPASPTPASPTPASPVYSVPTSPRPTSPRPTSPRPTSPNPIAEKVKARLSSVLSNNNLEDCEKKYGDKTSEQLTKLRIKSGHKVWGGKNEPTKAQNMEYLCALDNDLKCDPLVGEDCKGNLVCDVTNDTNVCVSKDLANERVKNPDRGLQEMEYEGKRIIGSAIAIKKLKEQIAAAYDESSSDYTPIQPQQRVEVDIDELSEQFRGFDVSSDYTPIPPQQRVEVDIDELNEQFGGFDVSSEYTPIPPQQRVEVEIEESDPYLSEELKPPPGTEVTDIEEVLRQIQEVSPDEDIDDLTATQRAVLKCLGILA